MTISERQNLPRAKALWAAQHYLYSRAKIFRGAASVAVLAVAIIGVIASAVDDQNIERLLPLLILLSWLFDQCMLSRMRAYRAEAAKIQEEFDCFVLSLDWTSYFGCQRPTEDRVKQLAAACSEKNRRPPRDWYLPSAMPDDPILAKLKCQRMNCWWDITLRTKWRNYNAWLFCGLGTLVLVLSFTTNITTAKFVGILAAGIRAVAWGVNEYIRQTKAINRLDNIHSFADSFRGNQRPTAVKIRGVQDAVFDHRRSAPLVPDWFYEWYRSRQEREAARFSDF